jgi:hypothetical protein
MIVQSNLNHDIDIFFLQAQVRNDTILTLMIVLNTAKIHYVIRELEKIHVNPAIFSFKQQNKFPILK